MDKDFINKLAKSVKEKRELKKLTQDDVGVNGISRSMVSLLELSKTDITVSKLKILADNMEVKVKDFFDFE